MLRSHKVESSKREEGHYGDSAVDPMNVDVLRREMEASMELEYQSWKEKLSEFEDR